MRPVSLVTGGAGFIGSHVAYELMKMGHRVVVLDDLSGGTFDNVPVGATFVKGDVSEPADVADVFARNRFDYVFHLAAYAAEGLSHFIKRHNYTNNVIGSVNLINAAVNSGRVKCFVFTSSIAVYGSAPTPMLESFAPTPEDPYGVAKHAVEQELRISHEMFGLPYVVFRPHNVYGDRQNLSDKFRNVIGIFMNKAMRGEAFPVFGDGEQTRAFSHISEVAPLTARSIEVPEAQGQIFNIGGDTPYTVNDLAVNVAAAMGVPAKIEYLPYRHEVKHAVASHDKVKAVFAGALPAPVPLADGLAGMAAWARRNGPQPPPFSPLVEIGQGLPPSWI